MKALRPVTDWKVSGVMNFSAAGVRITSTQAPAWVNLEARSAAL